MNHKHWEVQAYKVKLPGQPGIKDDYGMGDIVTISVLAESEKEALEKAKSTVKRKFYRLGKVWECEQTQSDPELSQRMQMAQLKILSKISKIV